MLNQVFMLTINVSKQRHGRYAPVTLHVHVKQSRNHEIGFSRNGVGRGYLVVVTGYNVYVIIVNNWFII